MTIDEAIKFCHEKSENIKLKAEPQVFIDIADMLEELKEYKATNYPKCNECAGCTQWNCDCANVRDKAIDDFFDELQKYEEADGWLRLKMSSIYEIAEQLKVK